MGSALSGQKLGSSSRKTEAPKSVGEKYVIPSAFDLNVNNTSSSTDRRTKDPSLMDISDPTFQYQQPVERIEQANRESNLHPGKGSGLILTGPCHWDKSPWRHMHFSKKSNDVAEDHQKGVECQMENILEVHSKDLMLSSKISNEAVEDHQKRDECQMENVSGVQSKLSNEVAEDQMGVKCQMESVSGDQSKMSNEVAEDQMGFKCQMEIVSGDQSKELNETIENEIIEKHKGSEERLLHVPCKYYLTVGGCKFGQECRFLHTKGRQKAAETDLNFVGLPLRPGEKECIEYMRTGFCRRGSKCWFHHPNPTPAMESACYGSTENDQLKRKMDNISCHIGGFKSMQIPMPLEPSLSESPSYLKSENRSPPDVCLSSPAQHEDLEVHLDHSLYSRKESSFLGSGSSYGKRVGYSDPFTNNGTQSGEYPDRPGKPECIYFIRTGSCKYGSRCRYHHPKRIDLPV